VALTHLREKHRKLNVSLDELIEMGNVEFQWKIAREDPCLVLTAKRIMFWNALAQLPPGYRTVFYLHEVEGYKHDEISQILRGSSGNSRSQLHRARLKLFSILNPPTLDKPKGKYHEP
jgi:RNA polymerase sigma-70 factor (ECF subfamily)